MAQKLGAKCVIDLATLTYSCHAALGDLTAGLYATISSMFSRLYGKLPRVRA